MQGNIIYYHRYKTLAGRAVTAPDAILPDLPTGAAEGDVYMKFPYMTILIDNNNTTQFDILSSIEDSSRAVTAPDAILPDLPTGAAGGDTTMKISCV